MALEITVKKNFNINVTVKQIAFEDLEINDQIEEEGTDEQRVEGELDLYYNPFGNCQTFCVANGNNLNDTGGDPESVRLILRKMLEEMSMKQQGMFDIRQDELANFLEVITPWAKTVHQMPYTSSNESLMCIILVHFNHKLICK